MTINESLPTSGTFEERAVWWIAKLLADFPAWNYLDAAADCGNLGRESSIQMIQEGRTTAGGWPGPNVAGGWGPPQWTGPRRVAFSNYCLRSKRDPNALSTGYAYHFVELKGEFANVIPLVAAAPDLPGKVAAFEQHYEMAGVVAMADRLAFAVRAQRAWEAHLAASPVPTTAPPPPPPPAKPAPTEGRPPMPTPTTTAAPAGSGISLTTIKRMLDNIDDEIDAFRDFPIVGSLASSIALILDPVRKAVDGGVIDTLRKSVDQIDNEIARLSALPFLGGFIGSIATVTHKIRVYVDAADPASTVAAAPGS